MSKFLNTYIFLNTYNYNKTIISSSKKDFTIYKFASNWHQHANVLQILSYIRISPNIRAKVLQICIAANMNLQWLPIPSTKFA